MLFYALLEGFIEIEFFFYKTSDNKSKADVKYVIHEEFKYNINMTRDSHKFKITATDETLKIVDTFTFSILDFDMLRRIGKVHNNSKNISQHE